MTNGDFYHNKTVIDTWGVFTDEAREKLYRVFEEAKKAPFKHYTDIVINMTKCTQWQADALLNEWLSRPKEKLTSEQVEKVLEEQGFTPKREYND